MLKTLISFIFGVLFCLLVLFLYKTDKDIKKLEHKITQNSLYIKQLEDLLMTQTEFMLKMYYSGGFEKNSFPFYQNDKQIIESL